MPAPARVIDHIQVMCTTRLQVPGPIALGVGFNAG
jgi:hypothetical protein